MVDCGEAGSDPLRIVVDDLRDEAIARFLEDHIDDMRSVSPPESKHALDLNGLRHPSITFWTVWLDNGLVACGALKDLGNGDGELKSMRTDAARRGAGIASRLLTHVIDEARRRGLRRLSLETGSMDFFIPARRLYARFGFVECPPFGGYTKDPNSVFMTLPLESSQASTHD